MDNDEHVETRAVVSIPEELVLREMDAIANAISDSCEPVIIPDIYPRTIANQTLIVVEIRKLCTEMKEVALANCKNDAQRQNVKDVTKNVLLSWGILVEAEDSSIHPTNAYLFLTGQDSFLSKIQCGMFKGTSRAVFVDKRDYDGPYGSRWRIHFSSCSGISGLAPELRACIVGIFMNCLRTAFVS